MVYVTAKWQCSSSHWKCKNEIQCVPRTAVCNHWKNCWDDSDEYQANCGTYIVRQPSDGTSSLDLGRRIEWCYFRTFHPYPKTKHEVDQMTRCEDITIRRSNFSRWRPAAILDLMEPEIAQFDPPTMQTHPRTKHEVNLAIRCRDMARFMKWRPYSSSSSSFIFKTRDMSKSIQIKAGTTRQETALTVALGIHINTSIKHYGKQSKTCNIRDT